MRLAARAKIEGMQRIKFNVQDLAEIAGISTRQVWRDVKTGRLPTPYINGRQAFWSASDEDVAAWVARRSSRLISVVTPSWSVPAGNSQLVQQASGSRGQPGQRTTTAAGTIHPLRISPPELTTVEELAIILHRSERSIWRMVDEGRLPPPEPKPLRPRLWRTASVWAWREKTLLWTAPAAIDEESESQDAPGELAPTHQTD